MRLPTCLAVVALLSVGCSQSHTSCAENHALPDGMSTRSESKARFDAYRDSRIRELIPREIEWYEGSDGVSSEPRLMVADACLGLDGDYRIFLGGSTPAGAIREVEFRVFKPASSEYLQYSFQPAIVNRFVPQGIAVEFRAVEIGGLSESILERAKSACGNVGNEIRVRFRDGDSNNSNWLSLIVLPEQAEKLFLLNPNNSAFQFTNDASKTVTVKRSCNMIIDPRLLPLSSDSVEIFYGMWVLCMDYYAERWLRGEPIPGCYSFELLGEGETSAPTSDSTYRSRLYETLRARAARGDEMYALPVLPDETQSLYYFIIPVLPSSEHQEFFEYLKMLRYHDSTSIYIRALD